MNNRPEPVSFDRVATEYERTRPLPPEIGDSIARYIVDECEQGWLLDAGCGTGRFTRPLSHVSSHIVGTDVSGEMLEELRRLHTPNRLPLLVKADLLDLPFLDSQFSGALTVHVLHLIAGWKEALAEIVRVLKPGGMLFLGFEDRTSSAVRDFYMKEGQRLGVLQPHPGARNTTDTIIPFIRESFSVVEEDTVAPPHWSWVKRVSVMGMFADLEKRLYSSQWNVADEGHQDLLTRTRNNAKTVFGELTPELTEDLKTQFVLHKLRKTG